MSKSSVLPEPQPDLSSFLTHLGLEGEELDFPIIVIDGGYILKSGLFGDIVPVFHRRYFFIAVSEKNLSLLFKAIGLNHYNERRLETYHKWAIELSNISLNQEDITRVINFCVWHKGTVEVDIAVVRTGNYLD